MNNTEGSTTQAHEFIKSIYLSGDRCSYGLSVRGGYASNACGQPREAPIHHPSSGTEGERCCPYHAFGGFPYSDCRFPDQDAELCEHGRALSDPCEHCFKAASDPQPAVEGTEEAQRMRRQEMTPERWEELQAALDRDGSPTEVEAEEVLQHFGTNGKEVTNQFIERLLRENLTLKGQVARLREALRELVNSPIDFDDARISYVSMQVDRDALDAARAALKSAEGKE